MSIIRSQRAQFFKILYITILIFITLKYEHMTLFDFRKIGVLFSSKKN